MRDLHHFVCQMRVAYFLQPYSLRICAHPRGVFFYFIGCSYRVKKRASNCTHSKPFIFYPLFFYPYPFGGPYLPFARFLQCIDYIIHFLVVRTFLSPNFFSAFVLSFTFWWSVPSFRQIPSVHSF